MNNCILTEGAVRTVASLRSIHIGLCLCLTLSISLFAQEKRPQDTSQSCRGFVVRFYDWYVKVDSQHKLDMSYRRSNSALKYRSYLFSSEIVRQVKEDDEAQDKAGSDLVSLDADPFVGADGFGERYIVGRITIKDGACWAEVHAVWDGKEDELPDVMPELVFKNSRWIFVNFYYPSPSDTDSSNLLGELKALRAMRKRFPSKGNGNP